MRRLIAILMLVCCMGVDTVLYDPINLVTEGTFPDRAASAWLLTPDGSTEFAAASPGGRRTQSVLVVSDSDHAGSCRTAVVTSTHGSDILTWTAHGLSDGDRVGFSHSSPSSPDLPNPLSVSTLYWVDVQSADTFKVCTTADFTGADCDDPVATTDDGTGTHYAHVDNTDLISSTPAAHPIVPQCDNGTYLFGVDYTSKILYRSTDGVNWTPAKTSFAPRDTVVALSTGEMLYCALTAAGPPVVMTVYRCAAGGDGSTWTTAQLVATGNFTLPDVIWPWGIADNGAGGVVLVTYGDATRAKTINYSADYGATWTVAESFAIGELTHLHAAGYHAATGKWIVNTGDSTGRRRDLISSDGTTWATYNLINLYRPWLFQGAANSSHTAQAADASSITLDSDDTAANDFYNGMQIAITGGTGMGETALILDYVNLTDVATIAVPWGTTPDATSIYQIQDPAAGSAAIRATATGGAAGTITLAATAATPTNHYIGMIITKIDKDATDPDETRRITAYNGTTKVATVTHNWDHAAESGDTYYILDGEQAQQAQTTRFRDYGDATYMLVGADYFTRPYLFSMVDYSVRPLVLQRQWVGGDTNSLVEGNLNNFDIVKVGGFWYALTENSGGQKGNRYAGIFVSPDLEHWACYAHTTTDRTDYGWLHYAGSRGGKMHLIYMRDVATYQAPPYSWQHASMTPAKATLRTGVMISPATANLLGADAAGCESLTGFTYSTNQCDSIALDSTTKLTGTYSVRVREQDFTAATPTYLLSPAPSGLTNDKWYIGSAWVRGTAERVRCALNMASGNYVVYQSFAIHPDSWTKITTLPAPYAGSNGNLNLEINPEKKSGDANVYIDNIMIAEIPGNWWGTGAATTEPEYISYSASLGSDWTHVFTIVPETPSKLFAEGLTRQVDAVTAGEAITNKGNIATFGADIDTHKIRSLGTGTSWTVDGYTNRYTISVSADPVAEDENYFLAPVTENTSLPIVTYRSDADDYVTLSLNSANTYSALVLAATDAGGAGDSVTSTVWIHGSEPIRVIVRCAGGELRLSYSYGGVVTHVSGLVTKAELATAATRTIITGSATIDDGTPTATDVLPHILLDSQLYNVGLSDAIINEMLVKTTWERWQRTIGGPNAPPVIGPK